MNYEAKKFFEYINGKNITFCGIGRSNIKLIDMFLAAGANITVCDKNVGFKNTEAYDNLSSKGVNFVLGDHYLDNLNADIIFRTPGISYLKNEFTKARFSGTIVTSEMEVFFKLCPCKIYAVTGSDGKTTTTTIISNILKNAGYNVHIGGNIGDPLLYRINSIDKDDVVVVELSSFQLMSMRKSPDVCVVTNISPNHLDFHKDMDEYVKSKENIITHQDAFGKAVLNSDNDVKNFALKSIGSCLFFSRLHNVHYGTYVRDKDIIYSDKKGQTFIMKTTDIKLKGLHNLENYLAAISAVFDDVPVDAIVKTAKEFTGVEHRTEFVRKVNGVSYFNDSIASSPTRTISGTLSLYDEKIILIAGGYDKHIPFDELGDVVSQKVKLLILMGDTAQKIKKAVENSKYYDKNKIEIIKVASMDDAVSLAYKKASYHDVVSLSPACASFGLYKNFEERGRHFKKLVNKL